MSHRAKFSVYVALCAILLLTAGCPTGVDVPYLVGMERDDAEALLENVGLAVGHVTSAYSDTVLAGTVLSHNPPLGVSAGKDTPVDLVVSRGRVILVNVESPAVGAGQDGLTWATAYSTLQRAIETAYFRTAELWVARGSYDENRTSTNAMGSLELRPGIRIYGGFMGVEYFREERNWQSNLTIIDGSNALDGEPADSVVIAADEALLDGLTIEGGDANFGGGGISIDDASQTLVNCTVRDNAALRGAGIILYSDSHLSASNCTFTHNAAGLNGGALYSDNGGDIDALHCTFDGNSAGSFGGALGVWGVEADLDGCIFTGNSSLQLGGALFGGSSSSLFVSNSIFVDNSAHRGGGVYSESAGTIYVTSNTFYHNFATEAGDSCYSGFDSMTVLNCILWGGTGSSEVGAAPGAWCNPFLSCVEGLSGASLFPGPPLFIDAPGGDFRLQAESTCIDRGHENDAPDHDIRGAARPQGEKVDLGAYEMTPADYK